MFLSVFDMFKVGIGPSSSHTMGPMVAAARFLDMMRASPFAFHGLRASLHGSLAFTGVGHATDRATILGLAGFRPDTYDDDKAEATLAAINETGTIELDGLGTLRFDPKADMIFDYDHALTGHANGMVLMATDAQGDVTLRQVFYSVGGGFVLTEEELAQGKATDEGDPIPYPFKSAVEMLEMAKSSGLTIAQMKRANEVSRGCEESLNRGTARLWQVMNDCINRGLERDGILPGGLKVRRRAKGIYDALMAERGMNLTAPHTINDWMSVYAMAVNEENAMRRSGGNRPHQWRGRRVACGAALLPRPCAGGVGETHGGFPADRRCDRWAGQIQCLDLGRRGGLPGRGGVRRRHGCCRSLCGHGRNT